MFRAHPRDPVLWADMKKMDKLIHHLVTEFYCDAEAANFPDAYIHPSGISHTNSLLLTRTPAVTPTGEALDRRWRQLPRGAYKVQACETWATLVCVFVACLITNQDLGCWCLLQVSVLADDLLLQLAQGTEETFVYYTPVACAVLGLEIKNGVFVRGRWHNNHVLVGYTVRRNRCTLAVDKLVASLLRREHYLMPNDLSIDEMQPLRAAGLSQINQGFDTAFQRCCAKFCERANRYRWPAEVAARVNPFYARGHEDLSLWSERNALSVADRGVRVVGPCDGSRSRLKYRGEITALGIF